MKPEKIKSLLTLLGSKATGTRGPWVEAKCPFAPWRHDGGKDKHPSFGIKADANKKSIYKCWSCGKGGDLAALHHDLAYLMGDEDPQGYDLGTALHLIASEFEDLEFDPDIPDYGESVTVDIKPYPESWLAQFALVEHHPDGLNYCLSRGLKLQHLRELDVRYDPVKQRVGFPFRDPRGRLMGMQGRDITGEHALRYYFYPYPGTKKTENMHAWLNEDKVDFDKPVVTVEGPFDLASVWRVYPNVLASFSSGVSDAKIKRLSDATEIITFYDNGKGGDSARARFAKVIKGVPMQHVTPEKEGADPGGMSPEEVVYHLKEYVPL